ncbi:MAG: InlB B-repeat-containing protein, partial [Bifidobacteriales bacterium]|nr:InlB B-repeat-containing protein [Bifidobacteriales bacterium]
AQALSQGFILLDTDGQAWYLAGNTASMTPVSLPDSAHISRITANRDQTMIVGKDDHVWTWKPGEAPKRADNGNQSYVQAASIGSRVTAISRQGSLYRWSLDGQGQPGRPARLDTTQAPILESASLDGQPLKLTKNNNLWQADMPAHKPGPAAITITGRQDGQPFTRNLNYTVDQTLTRDAESETSHTVDFNTGEGSPTPDPQQVSYPYGRVQRPSPDPVREGYQFSGWFIGEVAYDFSKPVTGNLILTAKWTPKSRNNKWRISPDKGSQLGNEATTITPPDSTSGVKFNQITNSIGSGGMHNSVSLAVGSDGNAYAWGLNDYGQLGDGTTTDRTTPVMVRKPDSKTYPDLLADFTYVQVSAGYNYSLAVGSDGYVYAWGRNNSGQLGNNSNNNSKVPVRVRDPANPRDTSKGLKAVQVDAGGEHSLAVDEEGNAYAWGRNNSGQLGNNTSGTYSDSSVPVRVRDPANPRDTSKGLTVIKVSAGGDHSLAIDKAGDTWAWGYNKYGQLGNNTSGFYSDSSVPVRVRDPNDSDDASKSLKSVQISAGYEHSLAIDAQGNTWSWGWNYWGELGQNTTSNIISTPSRVCDPNNPTIAFKTNQISAGYDFSLAIDNNGNTWSWGRNDYGELGYNSHDSRSAYHILPARVRNPAFPKNTELSLNGSQISAGNWHSLSIGKDGNAYAWGNNSYGQLGNNTTREADSPVLVVFNLQLVITGVKFDQTPATGLTRGDGSSVSVLTPAHQP